MMGARNWVWRRSTAVAAQNRPVDGPATAQVPDPFLLAPRREGGGGGKAHFLVCLPRPKYQPDPYAMRMELRGALLRRRLGMGHLLFFFGLVLSVTCSR